jgi:L-threonylcarbamoyladenylate synthase
LEIGKEISEAKKWLDAGDLVGIPTETVYGLAANGLDIDAVLKIYKAKNRPQFNPLILHVPYLSEAKKLVQYFPEKALILAEHFWPGPLTLVLPKKEIVPDIVSAGHNTVAIRIPNHPLTLQLLRQLDYPLAAPSANPSGYISPTNAQHVLQQLGDKVKYVLDGGDCQVGVESTIVKIMGDEATILRYGGLAVEDIEALIGTVEHSNENNKNPEAPGMMLSHYAPKAQVIIGDIEKNLAQHKGKIIGVLSFHKAYHAPEIKLSLQLSATQNIDEAARNIFAYLRQLDALQPEIILTELLPDEVLGKAVNDRLKRAAVK